MSSFRTTDGATGGFQHGFILFDSGKGCWDEHLEYFCRRSSPVSSASFSLSCLDQVRDLPETTQSRLLTQSLRRTLQCNSTQTALHNPHCCEKESRVHVIIHQSETVDRLDSVLGSLRPGWYELYSVKAGLGSLRLGSTAQRGISSQAVVSHHLPDTEWDVS